MIEIDPVTQQIYFYHAPEHDKAVDTTMHKFPLLSGYVCPECGRVLEANYVGELQVADSEGKLHSIDSDGESYLHPYMPRKYKDYPDTSDPKYTYGHKYGGGHLRLDNHEKTSCNIIFAKTAGIIEGLKSFINWIVPTPEIVPTDYMLKTFAGHIFENKVPGMYLIEDPCHNLEPLLAVNKKTFAEKISWLGYRDYYIEYHWNKALYRLVIGDPDVKINGIVPEPEQQNVEESFHTEVHEVTQRQHTQRLTVKRNVYVMIYDRLQKMGIIDENGIMKHSYMKFVSGGLMPLSVDNLGCVAASEGGSIQYLSLAHNGKQNGDIMRDPDMEVRIYPDTKMAEALTFKNDYVRVYQDVYTGDGRFYPKLKSELNSFLNSWLKRMIEDQKYVLEITKE